MIRELQRVEPRSRVWLDGIGLQDIDPAIVVQDISYTTPSIDTQTAEHARHHGERMLRQKVGQTTVTILFEVHEYNPALRQSIVDRVTAWAMSGGVLTVDDKPGRRLTVVCTTPPTVQSVSRWTGRLSLSLTAFDNPFWQDETPTMLILSGTSNAGNLYAPGAAADPYVEVEVKPTGTLTSATLTAGNTSIILSGLSIPSGKTLGIYYDERNTLHIERMDTGASLLNKRTAASYDDLMIPFSKFSRCSFTTNVSATVTFKVRGLYL